MQAGAYAAQNYNVRLTSSAKSDIQLNRLIDTTSFHPYTVTKCQAALEGYHEEDPRIRGRI